MFACVRNYCYFCSMKHAVMGILNCTPDSFYEGSRKQTDDEIAARADEIVGEGGTIIDVGAYSTRPGASAVSEEEEMRRLRAALTVIRRGHEDVTLSVDTFRPTVARMAAEEYGVRIINDVTEGCPEMFKEVARLGVGYVLMSVQPTVESMIANFRIEVATLKSLGVKEIMLDPGFGFGKDVIDGNYAVLRDMGKVRDEFPELPLLVGVSRKRMIWKLLGCTPQDAEALQGTMLVNLIALQHGATVLRVHDVKAAADTIKIFKSCFSHLA
ncbi:MAG: dihydropteroate synthase [Prevotella sp.]|nr:dihydropteroate synthase [Prevotella sp.]